MDLGVGAVAADEWIAPAAALHRVAGKAATSAGRRGAVVAPCDAVAASAIAAVATGGEEGGTVEAAVGGCSLSGCGDPSWSATYVFT